MRFVPILVVLVASPAWATEFCRDTYDAALDDWRRTCVWSEDDQICTSVTAWFGTNTECRERDEEVQRRAPDSSYVYDEDSIETRAARNRAKQAAENWKKFMEDHGLD